MSYTGTWEVFGSPRRVVAGAAEERREAGPKMNEPKKSDMGIVAVKPANKGAPATAEPVERRPMTNGNPQGQSTGRTQRRATVTQAAERTRQFVKREPQEKLTALLHHVTPDALRVAYYALKREAAPGVDGMTWHEYEKAGRSTRGEVPAQGSVISPTLANIYLHYVLDLWVIKKWRTQEAHGDMIIVRYADDYVVGFEHREDAERFLRDLRERFRGFELELNADKTRLIEFGRFAESNRRSRGEGRPETFDFLGFTHCGFRKF